MSYIYLFYYTNILIVNNLFDMFVDIKVNYYICFVINQ